ncbi:MAG: sporulation protein, partial [Oscillospiraceae bacterium]|nr:sporulation protein [Oscillospiraceae bacterium]
MSLDKLKDFLLFLLLALFAAALLFFPAEASDAARQGLRLCFQTVLPSLFPFFVLSALVVASGAGDAFGRALEPVMRPLFYLSGAGASALALGLVGGYPVGARTVAELYRAGNLSKAEAERLLSFCNNAGPGFILGICGDAVFGSVRAGLYLYLVHVAAAVLTGVLLRRCTFM